MTSLIRLPVRPVNRETIIFSVQRPVRFNDRFGSMGNQVLKTLVEIVIIK